jgi:hypothetical protein
MKVLNLYYHFISKNSNRPIQIIEFEFKLLLLRIQGTFGLLDWDKIQEELNLTGFANI